ncbi:hypothetical protein PNEG_00049 [Pneumocystis murina B123]|uniref:Rho-GAP domain-containing protein n=1 Tax=Pneumocystis murina (strain B123) TaxID=1069680 RepID=M7NS76_PNEMU|nr:hypothetical protein PNEG_00049 [Pneumocystis murina B123]EMR11608.1 hypothetical protein PNEG_00049 [Pneumocystis murina B123]
MQEKGQKLNEAITLSQKLSLFLSWRQFKEKQGWKKLVTEKTKGIFGVPLQISLRYANVAISFVDNNENSMIYGHIPVVVAKCGAFLKENAKDVKGIFRLNGSAKRCKELQTIFDTPPKYGRNLEWDGFTVHDAASILRRYLNYLPEPIIPHKFYEPFRKPLKNESYNKEEYISIYKRLIASLPPINRQLLLYILDLLAVFASKSKENLMTVSNLSSIFQPGILSHPEHDMSPKDYFLSQKVLIFLVDNQDHFFTNTAGIDSDLVISLTRCRDNDILERASTINSLKFASRKKHNVLKKIPHVSSKSLSFHKNKHSKSMDFNLKKSFRFLLRSNVLPNKSQCIEIDSHVIQDLVSPKKLKTLKNSKFPSRKLSIDNNTFYNKIKRRNSYSSMGTSTEDIHIYSTSRTSKNTKSKSFIYTFSSSLVDAIRPLKFQNKSLYKTIPINLSSSSLKTIGTCSNTSPLKLEAHRSSQSIHSAHSRTISIPSSLASEDKFSRDSSIFTKKAPRKDSSGDAQYI